MNIIETALNILTEKPLSKAARIKRARVMKRLAPKIQKKREISMKKKAGAEKIQARALKKAREVVRDKLLKGKSYDELSYGEKVAVDKKVEKKAGAIKKISKKLIPKVKKAEAERIKKLKANQ